MRTAEGVDGQRRPRCHGHPARRACGGPLRAKPARVLRNEARSETQRWKDGPVRRQKAKQERDVREVTVNSVVHGALPRPVGNVETDVIAVYLGQLLDDEPAPQAVRRIASVPVVHQEHGAMPRPRTTIQYGDVHTSTGCCMSLRAGIRDLLLTYPVP